MPKGAIFRLYRDGCPRVQRAGSHLKQAVNRALHALERDRAVVSYDEGKRRLSRDVIVHLPGQDPGLRRPAGVRKIEDVPLVELGAHIKRANAERPIVAQGERIALYRDVVRGFDMQRLTSATVDRVRRAEGLGKSQS